MSVSHIKISSDVYQNNIFSGFSRLQEQQEFVDLTLAADSHLVKVHKNIIALASPYLKEMLQKVSSAEPVIFLNNVSHKILCYLLEYIYQGEVNVPEDSIESFLQVSKSLHISGINNIERHQVKHLNTKLNQEQAPQAEITVIPSTDESFSAHIKINSDHNLEVNQVGDNLILDNLQNIYNQPNIPIEEKLENNTSKLKILSVDYVPNDRMVIDIMNLDQNNTLTENSNNGNLFVQDTLNTGTEPLPVTDLESLKLDKEATDALKIIPQYSISERGSLQIIVSRYIYCSHHNSRGGRKHRWRCIDYRKLRCPAFIDSLDGVITKRKGLHSHAYHDNKIYKKYSRKLIFHSLKQAMDASELPKDTVAADSDDFENTIEFNIVPKTVSVTNDLM